MGLWVFVALARFSAAECQRKSECSYTANKHGEDNDSPAGSR